MTTLICGRCSDTELQIFVSGVLTDPPGWSVVTLSGLPIVNRRLCRSCTPLARAALAKVLDAP